MLPDTWLMLVIVTVVPPCGAGARGKVPVPSTYSGGDISPGMGGLGVTPLLV